MPSRWSSSTTSDVTYLNPVVPFYSCASINSPTVGTPSYVKYTANATATALGVKFWTNTVTTPGVFEVGIYPYAATGNITKYTGVSGTVSVSSNSTLYSIMFGTPLTMVRGSEYHIGALVQSGSFDWWAKSSPLNNTKVNFLGATSQASLPTTESTRSAISYCPFLEFITA